VGLIALGGLIDLGTDQESTTGLTCPRYVRSDSNAHGPIKLSDRQWRDGMIPLPLSGGFWRMETWRHHDSRHHDTKVRFLGYPLGAIVAPLRTLSNGALDSYRAVRDRHDLSSYGSDSGLRGLRHEKAIHHKRDP